MPDLDEKVRARTTIFNVVESVVLAMSVGLMLWIANIVVVHGQTLSSLGTMMNVNSSRIVTLEVTGSRPLTDHVGIDETRVSDLKTRIDKLEIAIITLREVPGELKTVNVYLSTLKEGQLRLEKAIDQAASAAAAAANAAASAANSAAASANANAAAAAAAAAANAAASAVNK